MAKSKGWFGSSAVLLAICGTAAGVSAQESDEAQEAREERQEEAARGEAQARFGDAPNDGAGFGAAGQWAFSSDAALSLQRQTVSDVDGSTTRVILAPAADYFVIPNLSVGGTIGLTYTKAGESDSTRFSIGPRVGYNLGVSRLLSIWPKVGFSYAHTSSESDTPTGRQEVDSNAIALNLFVPIMLHPASHFFAGFGPFLDTDLSGDSQVTVWGVKLTLGGWI